MASRSDYRPDVDGLRAVAVLSVIITHFNPKLLPAGFVGVDIFFVISGFVVTSALLRMETGRLVPDLIEFWRRRCLRILPPLFVMVAVSTVAYALLFSPVPADTYAATLKTGVASLFGAGNLYLTHISDDYFQSDQSINVFLHTWSLGVEEQFYLIHAIIFLSIPALFGEQFQKVIRTPVLVGLSIASLGLFFWFAEIHPKWTYYGLPMRFWELGLGCLIALHRDELARLTSGAIAGRLLQMIGVLLLIAAFASGGIEGIGFTWPIVLGVAGAAVLISIGQGTRQPVSRLLATAPMVWVGKLSYSLYLWHWPVLVICRYTIGISSIATVVLAAALTVLLALASLKYVETPWRHAKLNLFGGFVPRFAAAAAVIILATAGISKFPGSVFLGAEQNQMAWLPARSYSYTGDGRLTSASCDLDPGDAIPENIPEACRRAVPVTESATAVPTVLLAGDSHSFSIWEMARYEHQRGAFALSALSYNGCGPLGKVSEKSASCLAYLGRLPDLIRRDLGPGDVMLVSFHFPYKRERHIDFTFARRFFASLVAAAKDKAVHLVVEAPPPQFTRPAFVCTEDWFRLDYTGCKVTRAKFDSERKPVMDWLAALRAGSGGAVTIYDSAPRLCASGTCSAVDGTAPVFRDKNHLSFLGAKALGPHFKQFVDNLKSREPNLDDRLASGGANISDASFKRR